MEQMSYGANVVWSKCRMEQVSYGANDYGANVDGATVDGAFVVAPLHCFSKCSDEHKYSIMFL